MKPIFALTVRQPWAYYLATGLKDCENRGWRTIHARVVVIHAGQTMGAAVERDIEMIVRRGLAPAPDRTSDAFKFGGFIGVALFGGSRVKIESPWFAGPFAMPVSKAMPLPFKAAKGRLNFWNLDWLDAGLGSIVHAVEDWRTKHGVEC